eukprot:scaffold3993_cov81-Skeletonema_dohrnii-CCMP3373.AAC.1
MECCSKRICIGCKYANIIREAKGKLKHTCPFCRHPLPKSDEEGNRNLMQRIEEEADKNSMKRIEANDPVAFLEMSIKRRAEGDIGGAFEYLTKAAELGDAEAHYTLAVMYYEGKDVEKDEKKEVYHLEKAAIGGHPGARYNLGCYEGERFKFERAVKHWIIAANLGDEDSMHNVRDTYRSGLVSKEDYAAALRGHQAAIDAMKSPQREEAEAFVARHR